MRWMFVCWMLVGLLGRPAFATDAAGEPAGAGEDPSGYKALLTCRDIETPEQRLACYDVAVDKFAGAVATGEVNVVEKKAIRELQRDSFGISIPGANALVSLFNRGGRADKPTDSADDKDRAESGPAQRNGIEESKERGDGAETVYGKQGQIKSIRNNPVRDVTYTQLGYIRVTLENGQVWQQSDPKSLRKVTARLKTGLKADIRRGALGSYFMKLSHDSRAFRARRIE